MAMGVVFVWVHGGVLIGVKFFIVVSWFLYTIHICMYVYIGKKEGMDMNGNWEMNEGIYIDAKYELEEVSRRAN